MAQDISPLNLACLPVDILFAIYARLHLLDVLSLKQVNGTLVLSNDYLNRSEHDWTRRHVVYSTHLVAQITCGI